MATSIVIFIIIWLYEADGASRLAVSGLSLEFKKGVVDGCQLGAGALVDVVLVMQDVLDVEFEFFEVLAESGYVSSCVRQGEGYSHLTHGNECAHNRYIHIDSYITIKQS